MPFNRPTLAELVAAAETEINVSLPGADAQLRRTVLGVLARVISGGDHGLYGFIQDTAKQILPDTADAEILARHAAIWGVARSAAAFATGNVTFTGTDATVIPAGTELLRADSLRYQTDGEGTIAAGVALVTITAIDAGADGDAIAATQLSMVSPIAGINSVATIDGSGITAGADEETDAALLARVLDRIQTPPHGGAGADYVTWALDVANVTRAWVYAQELGLGTVSLRFMMDDIYGDGIPLAADVTAVQDAIDALRPVTADLTVVAPVPTALNLTIAGLDPVTQAVKDAIATELADLIRREAIPGGTILLSHIREAVSVAAGENDHDVTVPAADVAHATGQIAVMGVITWS
ncbi:MAG: baseplate J protein [Rhodospirillaceae bacterium]|nr:MAG: baseplate J protein [Rhodospirillaceae bacterium]